MVFKRKSSSYFEKSKKIYGEGNVWCKICHCCLEGHPLQVRHKQEWDWGLGQAFILLEPQAAILSRSDAGSNVVKLNIKFSHPKLSIFVLHVVPNRWAGY